MMSGVGRHVDICEHILQVWPEPRLRRYIMIKRIVHKVPQMVDKWLHWICLVGTRLKERFSKPSLKWKSHVHREPCSDDVSVCLIHFGYSLSSSQLTPILQLIFTMQSFRQARHWRIRSASLSSATLRTSAACILVHR